MFQLVTPWRAYQVRAACGRMIGMCGYPSALEDGHSCYLLILSDCLSVLFEGILVGHLLQVDWPQSSTRTLCRCSSWS